MFTYSLLSQVSCHVTPLEALQVEQPLSQSLGSLCVGTATVGEGISAAPLQGLQAAQFRVRVAQAICEIGITTATKMTTLDLHNSRFNRIYHRKRRLIDIFGHVHHLEMIQSH